MKTHRCEGSLKAQTSIRFDKRYSFGNGNIVWNLRTLSYDSEYDSTTLVSSCVISYCPFCGMKLKGGS